MRKQTEINGYILNDAERGARLFTKYIGIPMLVLLLIFLCKESIKKIDNAVLWGFSALWLVIVVFCIIGFHSSQIIDNMQFFVTDKKLTNISKSKTEITLELTKQFYITTLSIEFGYGKSIQKRVFYLFSYHAFSIDDIKGNGLNTLKHLHRNEIVIIPKQKDIEEWICFKLKIRNIPEFPANIVNNQINQSEDSQAAYFDIIDG